MLFIHILNINEARTNPCRTHIVLQQLDALPLIIVLLCLCKSKPFILFKNLPWSSHLCSSFHINQKFVYKLRCLSSTHLFFFFNSTCYSLNGDWVVQDHPFLKPPFFYYIRFFYSKYANYLSLFFSFFIHYCDNTY